MIIWTLTLTTSKNRFINNINNYHNVKTIFENNVINRLYYKIIFIQIRIFYKNDEIK